MVPRLIVLALFVALVGGFTALAWYGVQGASGTVVSARTGSPGGGYGVGGRVK
ncbi:MAG: hypothetical protein AAF074_16400 [Pseudomonadota bacterium]